MCYFTQIDILIHISLYASQTLLVGNPPLQGLISLDYLEVVTLGIKHRARTSHLEHCPLTGYIPQPIDNGHHLLKVSSTTYLGVEYVLPTRQHL